MPMRVMNKASRPEGLSASPLGQSTARQMFLNTSNTRSSCSPPALAHASGMRSISPVVISSTSCTMECRSSSSLSIALSTRRRRFEVVIERAAVHFGPPEQRRFRTETQRSGVDSSTCQNASRMRRSAHSSVSFFRPSHDMPPSSSRHAPPGQRERSSQAFAACSRYWRSSHRGRNRAAKYSHGDSVP